MITCPCILIYYAHEKLHSFPPPKVIILTPTKTKRMQAGIFAHLGPYIAALRWQHPTSYCLLMFKCF